MAQQHMTIEVPVVSSKARLKEALEKGLAHIGDVTIHKNGRLNIEAGEAARAAFSTMDIDGKINRKEDKYTVDLEAESKVSGWGWAASVFCFPIGLLSLMQPKRSIGMLKKVCREAGNAMCNVAEGVEPSKPKHDVVRRKRRIIAGSVIAFIVATNVIPLVHYASMSPEERAAIAQEIAVTDDNNEKIREAAADYVDSIYGLNNEQKVDAFMDYYVRHGGTDAFNTRQGLTLALKRAQREYDFDRGKISIW